MEKTTTQQLFSKHQVYILFAFLIFIWGISWPISKIGIDYIPAIWYASFRLITATVFMFIIVTLMGRLSLPQKEDWKIILTMGLLQIGILVLLNSIGLAYVQPGRSAILVYTTPLWVLPISVLCFGEKQSWIKWGSFTLGLVGIAMLFNPKSIDWHNFDDVFGNFILLASALCWALSILAARHMTWTRPPIELIAWQMLVGTIPVLIFSWITMPHPHFIWNHDSILSVLFIGFFGTALALWGSIVVSRTLPPFTTSINFLIIPVVSVVFSALMVHEPITITMIVAITFIIFGALLLALENKAGA